MRSAVGTRAVARCYINGCQRWESGPLPRETHPAAQKMRPRTNAPRAHASVNGIGCASASCTAMLTTPMPLTMCRVLCGSTRGK